MKKSFLISIVLVFIFALALSACNGDTEPPTANNTTTEIAESESVGLAYSVNADGQSCTITGMGTCQDTAIIIPEKIEGYTVTAIGEKSFQNYPHLIAFTLPESVTSIGDYAFDGCTGATSFVIKNGVTSIGDRAFGSCSRLESITLPDSVITIGPWAFYNCDKLTSVVIPNFVTSIGDYSFSSCDALKSITFPKSLTSIGRSVFYYTPLEKIYYLSDCSDWVSIITSENPGCSYHLYFNGVLVTDLVIPDSVTSIRDHAFRNCTSLESINIPNSVTGIGEEAFAGCSNLKSIIIPNSVTSIGKHSFRFCESLASIQFQGTKAQWDSIKKHRLWSENTVNYTLHCTDGDFSKGI